MELSELEIQEARHPEPLPVSVPVGSLVWIYQGHRQSFLVLIDVRMVKCQESLEEGSFLRK